MIAVIVLGVAVWAGYYCSQLFKKARRPAVVGFLVGLLMFPIGFLIANGLFEIWTSGAPQEDDPQRPCPQCGEAIHAAAKRCTYCAASIAEKGAA